MKRTFVRFIVCLTAMFCTTQLFGGNLRLVRVSVPFEFTVAGTRMPAGDYSIERNGDGGALFIRAMNNKGSGVFVLSLPAAASKAHESSVTFVRDGGLPALTMVNTDYSIARSLPTVR